ncbi:MAG: hypothetical protein GC162_14470 [Planctomycetes bacterium]|nr:hypothetical protein [Planctomycetota bacterium]
MNQIRQVRGSQGVGAAFVMALVVATAGVARADARPFVFTYEVTTMPVGAVEYEQWVTWKTSKAIDSDYDAIDFRHEIEFGVTDHFQLGLYVSDWGYEDGDSVTNDGTRWNDVAIEGIYNLSDPVADPIGVALYGEIKGGDEVLGVEGKLLLQKNIGSWIIAWNGVIEAEWEGDHFDDDNGTLEQTLGISYQVTPSLLLGAELVHEIDYADWSAWGPHVVYAGPNVSYRKGNWWVTVAPLFQLTRVDDEADFQTRLIFGINF